MGNPPDRSTASRRSVAHFACTSMSSADVPGSMSSSRRSIQSRSRPTSHDVSCPSSPSVTKSRLGAAVDKKLPERRGRGSRRDSVEIRVSAMGSERAVRILRHEEHVENPEDAAPTEPVEMLCELGRQRVLRVEPEGEQVYRAGG